MLHHSQYVFFNVSKSNLCFWCFLVLYVCVYRQNILQTVTLSSLLCWIYVSYANIQNQQVIQTENWFMLILCIMKIYIYICTYLYLCICIYDMNTPLLRSYWDKHPTFAYLKKTTGVTGVSPGLPIVDVAASASYVNFTDQVKQNEGGKWWQDCVAEPWVKKLKRLVTKYMYCRYYLFEVFFSHHPVFWLIFSWWCSKGGQKQTLQHVACWKSILSNRKTCSN